MAAHLTALAVVVVPGRGLRLGRLLLQAPLLDGRLQRILGGLPTFDLLGRLLDQRCRAGQLVSVPGQRQAAVPVQDHLSGCTCQWQTNVNKRALLLQPPSAHPWRTALPLALFAGLFTIAAAHGISCIARRMAGSIKLISGLLQARMLANRSWEHSRQDLKNIPVSEWHECAS